MFWKNSFYILLVIAIAGISALTGPIAGGVIVYRTFQQSASLPAPVQEILPSSNTDPSQFKM